ncbi:MAG: PEP/pyruvate-binding domain-containing protein [Planctomycetota bacterium]
MPSQDSSVKRIVAELQERAKELNCLYTVEELLRDPDTPLEQALRGVIDAIPPGWQYPNICQARIKHEEAVYQPPTFTESPWRQVAQIRVQREPVGTLEVSYIEETPLEDEGPFLKEERKLIETIADVLGNCIMHRRLAEAMGEWQSAQQELSKHKKSEWLVILDLLRRTDQSQLLRVARKMINHLCWSGIKEADTLLKHFGIEDSFEQQELFADANHPRPKDEFPTGSTLVDEVFKTAAAHLSDEEIVSCIHTWIKQDRASFLVNTLENHHTSLAEVGDAISRYQHTAQGEVELSSSTRKGLRVSLVRRLLSDQIEYVNVAKNYIDIKDFHGLMQRTIFPPQGHGKVGGKAAGLILASQIIRRSEPDGGLLAGVKIPKTWYVTSDGLHNFIYCNHLEDVFTQKYKDIDEIRQEYPDIIQVFKHSHFSSDIVKGLSVALDDFRDRPLIVRSSSLLEDRVGAAFSGKYKSLFLANQGSKQDRLTALMDAIAEVYASTFGPDPIEYRAERNLLDFQEGMGILIQEVVGTKVGHYFLPTFAGVAFNYNEFRWSARIKREDGLVRLVPGLGTRAVDRLGDDYPILISPGQPGLRANATVEETVRYSPRYLDAINLKTSEFETVEATEFLRNCGDKVPGIEQLVSIYDQGSLRQPMLGQVDFDNDDLVVTFEGLLTRTPFLKQIQQLLLLLQKEFTTPVDIEFASDGKDLYLLQCRAQNPAKFCAPAPIPRNIPREEIVFSANRYVSNGSVPNITHIVYVDPEAYSRIGSLEELTSVGRAVSRLNKLLPKRQFLLMGPGRWGSRGDIKLGVSVTYSDINNTAMLIEIARKKGDYTPDLSFGTHFFQDLVEASIRYLPLYPDEEGVVFNERFLKRSDNILPDIAPEFAALADVVYVIDVPKAADDRVLRVLMNADLGEAVGVLAQPVTSIDSVEEAETTAAPQQAEYWRWRLRMAENVAARLDSDRFGVQGFYVFGSTKNATAGPASDIDVLLHFRGSPQQRQSLDQWLEGWSLCLGALNYLRTGYKTDELLDVHIVTDDDIANRTSYAAKIDAITDAARPLPLMDKAPDAK